MNNAEVAAEKNRAGICRVCRRTLKNPKHAAAGIGPVCARKGGIAKAGLRFDQGGADFGYEITTGGVLIIEDLNRGNISVTNDMENVLKKCGATPGQTIIYKDSAGTYDQVLYDGGRVKFKCIGTKDRAHALALIASGV